MSILADLRYRLLSRSAQRKVGSYSPGHVSSAGDDQNVIFSCVVDSSPRAEYSAWLWATTLMAFGKRSPSSLAVHFIDGSAPELRGVLDAVGVSTVSVERPDPSSPRANELAQLGSPLLANAEHCVLCECDLAFCADISAWVGGDRIRAAPADGAVLGPDRWAKVLAAADLHRDEVEPADLGGGLLVVPRGHLATLKEKWPRWYRWLADRPELLDPVGDRVSRVSLALSCLDAGIEVDPLPGELGVPTYLDRYPRHLKGIDPVVLRFGDDIDSNGRLRPTGVKSIDKRVARVNSLVDDALHRDFDNRLFWNYRYATHPQLGSGVGSRGKVLEAKRKMLESVLDELRPQSVLDVGCGDLELWRGLSPPGYTGIDVSRTAVEIARQKRPDLRFEAGDIRTLGLQPHDLALALDVLIHQPSQDAYEQLLAGLIELTGKRLVVSGYQRPPATRSAITFFFEPVTQTLTRLAPGGHVAQIGRYRAVEIVSWVRD